MFILALARLVEGGRYFSPVKLKIFYWRLESGSSREMDRQDIRRGGGGGPGRINIVNYFSLLTHVLMSSQNVPENFLKTLLSVLMFFVGGLVER